MTITYLFAATIYALCGAVVILLRRASFPRKETKP
jgi:hypothetical protein